MLDFTLHFRDVAVPRLYSFFTLSPERRDISRLYILHLLVMNLKILFLLDRLLLDLFLWQFQIAVR